MKEIIIATHNKGKAREYKELFKKYEINAFSLLDLPETIPEVEETGTTFAENAALKAQEVSSILNQSVMADDSGLVIDALDGRPGIYSARYAGEGKVDLDNNKKVMEELSDVPEEKRTARFVCVLAIAIPGQEIIFKTGISEGKIAYSMVGNNGFGYDPIFIPNGYDHTMAELPAEIKNKISHRYDAMVKLDGWIKAYKN